MPYRQPGSWHSPRPPSLANVGVFMSWTRAQSGPRLLTVTDRTPATIGMLTGQAVASIIVFDKFARPRKLMTMDCYGPLRGHTVWRHEHNYTTASSCAVFLAELLAPTCIQLPPFRKPHLNLDTLARSGKQYSPFFTLIERHL